MLREALMPVLQAERINVVIVMKDYAAQMQCMLLYFMLLME